MGCMKPWCRLNSAAADHPAATSDSTMLSRKETGKLQEFTKSPKAKAVVLHEGKCLVRPAETQPMQTVHSQRLVADHQTAVKWQPVYLTPDSLEAQLKERYQPLFLGIDPEGSPIFAAVVHQANEATTSAQQYTSKVGFFIPSTPQGPCM